MENNGKSGNNFMGGFLLGFLFGGLVVFLLATKKGKKVFKAITEEGTDKLADILEQMDKTGEIEEYEEPSFAKASEGQREESVRRSTVKVVSVKPKVRRFFRGASKHVN